MWLYALFFHTTCTASFVLCLFDYSLSGKQCTFQGEDYLVLILGLFTALMNLTSEFTGLIFQYSVQDGYGESVPIIALTANAISGVNQEYLAQGMDGCLFKPLVLEELKKELARWLHKGEE